MAIKKLKNTNKSESHKKMYGGLFIPAGLFIGMGIGFLFHQMLAGIFLGLGVGYLLFSIFRKYND